MNQIFLIESWNKKQRKFSQFKTEKGLKYVKDYVADKDSKTEKHKKSAAIKKTAIDAGKKSMGLLKKVAHIATGNIYIPGRGSTNKAANVALKAGIGSAIEQGTDTLYKKLDKASKKTGKKIASINSTKKSRENVVSKIQKNKHFDSLPKSERDAILAKRAEKKAARLAKKSDKAKQTQQKKTEAPKTQTQTPAPVAIPQKQEQQPAPQMSKYAKKKQRQRMQRHSEDERGFERSMQKWNKKHHK